MVSDQQIQRVQAVIDELDPEGLLVMGAPADEYCDEAAELAGWMGEELELTLSRVESYWKKRFYVECGLVQLRLAGPLTARLEKVRVEYF